MIMPEASQISRGIDAAHEQMLGWYFSHGGHRFHGWIDHKEPRSYLGNGIWTEADCVYQFARALEAQFPGWIHLEFKINKATQGPGFSGGPRQSIDIVVCDLDRFREDETSLARFQGHRHEAFIEAKWLKKGLWGEKWEHMAAKQTEAVLRDAERLQLHLEEGRCEVAAVLVVDDECYFQAFKDEHDWPRDVEVLIVGPSELDRRGMRDRHVEAAIDKAIKLSGADKFMWTSDDQVEIYKAGTPEHKALHKALEEAKAEASDSELPTIKPEALKKALEEERAKASEPGPPTNRPTTSPDEDVPF